MAGACVASDGNRLKLTDLTTGASTFAVANVGQGTTASDLGLTTAAVGDTISGFVWQPGELLVLRWSDPNHAGNDHGLSIDNLSFSAVPGPGAGTLLGAGLILSARRRRR